MRAGIFVVAIASLGLSACALQPVTPIQPVDPTTISYYANYCVVPYSGPRSAASIAESGFAGVEQQCGIFFDKLTELTQFGRFGDTGLTSTSLGVQTIMQAAKAAAQSVAIVGAAFTLSDALLKAFIQQYAFSPYLYKIRELTFQALNAHTSDSGPKLAQLKTGFTADDYCDAAILIQHHASICTISSIQGLFDAQVANTTTVTNVSNVNKGAAPGPMRPPGAAGFVNRPASPGSTYIPMKAPNFTVH